MDIERVWLIFCTSLCYRVVVFFCFFSSQDINPFIQSLLLVFTEEYFYYSVDHTTVKERHQVVDGGERRGCECIFFSNSKWRNIKETKHANSFCNNIIESVTITCGCKRVANNGWVTVLIIIMVLLQHKHGKSGMKE